MTRITRQELNDAPKLAVKTITHNGITYAYFYIFISPDPENGGSAYFAKAYNVANQQDEVIIRWEITNTTDNTFNIDNFTIMPA
jgi:hypothetical protein